MKIWFCLKYIQHNRSWNKGAGVLCIICFISHFVSKSHGESLSKYLYIIFMVVIVQTPCCQAIKWQWGLIIVNLAPGVRGQTCWGKSPPGELHWMQLVALLYVRIYFLYLHPWSSENGMGVCWIHTDVYPSVCPSYRPSICMQNFQNFLKKKKTHKSVARLFHTWHLPLWGESLAPFSITLMS